MRYLRMLTNAVVAALVASAYLLVLILQLNPQVPLASMTTVRWFGSLLAHYGPYLTVTVYVLMLIGEAIVSRALRPAWLSVRVLAWLGAAGAAAAAYMTWANLSGFEAVLGTDAADRMRQGATTTTVAAGVLVTIAALRYSFRRRGSRLTGVVLVVSLIASVAVPLWLRGPGDVPVPAVRRAIQPPQVAQGVPRVRLILLDAASLDFIKRRVAAGRLPNFGRVLDRGATIDLATIKPTQAVPVWAAASTGKYPPKNGVRSDALYRVAADDDAPVSLLPDFCFAQSLVYQRFVMADPHVGAGALHARTLWDILTDYAISSGVTNMPLTRPARIERGYIVSDYFDEATQDPLRLADRQSAYPSSAADAARDAFDEWEAKPWFDVVPRNTAAEMAPLGVQTAVWDHAYRDAQIELDRQFGPRLSAIRFEALNAFGKWYLREAEPERFGQVAGGDLGRSVLDRSYAFIDAEVGRAIDLLAPNDLLLVVSGFGMEDVQLSKRLLARILGRSDPNGGHERAPDGFLMAYGTNVARGQFSRGSIVDVTPTVLYYLGVPVGRDMDGYARTDLFQPSYTLSHTVRIIGTHENRLNGGQ